MHDVFQTYHKIFDDNFIDYRFRRYKNTYYRIINDTVQSFFLQNQPIIGTKGGNLAISIHQAPICMKTDLIQLQYALELRLGFLTDNFDRWFYYSDKTRIEEVLIALVELCNKYMMPFFDDCSNSMKCLESEVFNRFIKDTNPEIFVYVCLKCNLLDDALAHIAKIQNLHKENVYKNIENMRHMAAYLKNEDVEQKVAEYVKKSEDYHKPLIEIRDAIVAKDFSYLENLIHRNEAYTIEAITKNIRKKSNSAVTP